MPLTFLKVRETRRDNEHGRLTARHFVVADGDRPIGAAVVLIAHPTTPGPRYKCTVSVHGIRHELGSLDDAKIFAEGVHLGMMHKNASEKANGKVVAFRGKT